MAYDRFRQELVELSLISAEQLEAVATQLSAEQSDDNEQFAQELVRHKILTPYQARQCCDGLAKGLRLGDYLALDQLGQGDHGIVFKAEQRRTKRVVAIKALFPSITQSDDAAERFRRELEVDATLRHPNIAISYGAEEDQGTYFLVMEYVVGQDLADLVQLYGPMLPAEAMDCVLQAARGLEYAHQQGLVHGNVKPTNLLLDHGGTLKILDLGLSKRCRGLPPQQDPRNGSRRSNGTFDFMAPECALDAGAADERSDVYSLGATLWFLLTGRVLQEANSFAPKITAEQQVATPTLCDACAEASSELEAIFERMVARAPADRYSSMTELIGALERCRSGRSAPATIVAESVARVPVYSAANASAENSATSIAAVACPSPCAREATAHAGTLYPDVDGIPAAAIPAVAAAALPTPVPAVAVPHDMLTNATSKLDRGWSKARVAMAVGIALVVLVLAALWIIDR